MWYHRVIGGWPLPDRGYMVANRDGRHSDFAAASGHDGNQAGFVHETVAGYRGRHR